jgi:malonyl-CoA O-methyltransferase
MGVIHFSDIGPDPVAIKHHLAQEFSHAATKYDHLAKVQKRIATVALQRLSKEPVAVAVDLGCGTGRHTPMVGLQANNTLALDIAYGMLQQTRTQSPQVIPIQADAEALPLASASVQRVFSSMMLQWCRQPDVVMAELHRVLSENGTAELAIMVAGSFHELHAASVKSRVAVAINHWASAASWQQAAINAGFDIAAPVSRGVIDAIPSYADNHSALGSHKSDATATYDYIDTHKNILSLLRSIKHIGASTLTEPVLRQGLTRAALQRLAQGFATQTGTQPDELRLTYRVCHLSLRKP